MRVALVVYLPLGVRVLQLGGVPAAKRQRHKWLQSVSNGFRRALFGLRSPATKSNHTSARSSALLHARSSEPLARLLKGDHDGDDDDGHADEAAGEGCGAEHVLHAGAVADEDHENDFGDEGVGEVPATARVMG